MIQPALRKAFQLPFTLFRPAVRWPWHFEDAQVLNVHFDMPAVVAVLRRQLFERVVADSAKARRRPFDLSELVFTHSVISRLGLLKLGIVEPIRVVCRSLEFLPAAGVCDSRKKVWHSLFFPLHFRFASLMLSLFHDIICLWNRYNPPRISSGEPKLRRK